MGDRASARGPQPRDQSSSTDARRLRATAGPGDDLASHSNLNGCSRFGEDFAIGPPSHCGHENSAKEWSPEAIGEEGEDFPLFTILRHTIFQPLGIVPAEYPLPGERATFYVPRSEDNNPRRGRRLMYMRDLACCAKGMAFYSTPSDLVRVALATKSGDVNGDLAGGMVVSLINQPDTGIVVAVTSNIAHANTSTLARQVADAFARQTR